MTFGISCKNIGPTHFTIIHLGAFEHSTLEFSVKEVSSLKICSFEVCALQMRFP